MLKTVRLVILCLMPVTAASFAAEQEQEREPVTLESLVANADYIGLLQVDDREYEEVRDVPTRGVAFLRALVTYRHPGELRHPPEEVQVHEEGVGERKCYYPERRNEGHRFLAFLQKRPDEEGYTGERPGCMLPVYVTEDNRYALRYPIEGLAVNDQSLVREIRFSDPDAFVDSGSDMSYARTRELRDSGLIRQTETGEYVFTRGIYLNELRPILLAGDSR